MIQMEKIRSKTAGRTLEEVSPVKRKNAVLIPLVETGGELSILFEVRQTGIRQGGEICFPEKIELIAPMHVMTGPGGAKISSCLGILRDYEGTYSKQEVERVFCVPLSWFASHKPRISNASMVVKTPEDFPYELLPGGENYPWHSIPRRFYFYESDGGVIWGITAQLLYHCLKVILSDDTETPGADGEDREFLT